MVQCQFNSGAAAKPGDAAANIEYEDVQPERIRERQTGRH